MKAEINAFTKKYLISESIKKLNKARKRLCAKDTENTLQDLALARTMIQSLERKIRIERTEEQ